MILATNDYITLGTARYILDIAKWELVEHKDRVISWLWLVGAKSLVMVISGAVSFAYSAQPTCIQVMNRTLKIEDKLHFESWGEEPPTRWGVCIGERVSRSDVGNSMPFLLSSSYTWTTPVRSGLLRNASAHAWNGREKGTGKSKQEKIIKWEQLCNQNCLEWIHLVSTLHSSRDCAPFSSDICSYSLHVQTLPSVSTKNCKSGWSKIKTVTCG